MCFGRYLVELNHETSIEGFSIQNVIMCMQIGQKSMRVLTPWKHVLHSLHLRRTGYSISTQMKSTPLRDALLQNVFSAVQSECKSLCKTKTGTVSLLRKL